MSVSRIMISSHKGLGLLIGIQILLWISGGFVMSVLPLEKVRGEDWAQESDPAPLPASTPLLAPDAIARQLGLPSLATAELTTWLRQPVYRLHANKKVHLVDAVSGVELSPLNAETAAKVARTDYTGPDKITRTELWDQPIFELRGAALPVWRVDFGDSRHTTVYVSPQSGRVVSRRNRLWRVYDFFWMLHIMDYRGREDFNHPLLVTAAVLAWLLATSGIWLVIWGFRRKKRRRKT